jgi:hypothetical protein
MGLMGYHLRTFPATHCDMLQSTSGRNRIRLREMMPDGMVSPSTTSGGWVSARTVGIPLSEMMHKRIWVAAGAALCAEMAGEGASGAFTRCLERVGNRRAMDADLVNRDEAESLTDKEKAAHEPLFYH